MLGNENQVMEFNTNEDGSITGEFTLRLRARKEVLRVLPIGEQVKSNKKIEFDKEYAEEIYMTYNSNSIDDQKSRKRLQKEIGNKTVFLIGPGKSILEYQQEINNQVSDKNIFSISINSKSIFNTNALFFSNKKRYEEQDCLYGLVLLTSNIKVDTKENEMIFDYQSSLAREKGISDSSVLMMLSILKDLNVQNVIMAGFDGFTTGEEQDFYKEEIEYLINREYAKSLNKIIKENINGYKKVINIKTITPSINI